MVDGRPEPIGARSVKRDSDIRMGPAQVQTILAQNLAEVRAQQASLHKAEGEVRGAPHAPSPEFCRPGTPVLSFRPPVPPPAMPRRKSKAQSLPETRALSPLPSPVNPNQTSVQRIRQKFRAVEEEDFAEDGDPDPNHHGDPTATPQYRDMTRDRLKKPQFKEWLLKNRAMEHAKRQRPMSAD